MAIWSVGWWKQPSNKLPRQPINVYWTLNTDKWKISDPVSFSITRTHEKKLLGIHFLVRLAHTKSTVHEQNMKCRHNIYSCSYSFPLICKEWIVFRSLDKNGVILCAVWRDRLLKVQFATWQLCDMFLNSPFTRSTGLNYIERRMGVCVVLVIHIALLHIYSFQWHFNKKN